MAAGQVASDGLGTNDGRRNARPLEGLVAFVAGGAGGIGSHISRELAVWGGSVIVNDLDPDEPGHDRIGPLVEEIEKAGGTALAHRGTALTPAGAKDAAAVALDHFGRIDIVIDAAGIGAAGGPLEIDDEQWHRVLRIHVGGHLALAAAFLPHLGVGGYGRLINFTSGAGFLRERSALFAYASAKRAVAALTWELAARVRDAGVTVNAISPLALTPMSAPPPGQVRSHLQELPDPALVAPVVAFVASPAAAHLHGRVIYTNGIEVSLVEPERPIELIDGWTDGGDELRERVVTAIFGPSAAANASIAGQTARVPVPASP